ncbi:hypothetical protein E2320_014270, partial [Naja naja]
VAPSCTQLFKAGTMQETQSGTQVTLLILLLLVLFCCPQAAYETLKVKCLLTLNRDGMNPLNYYRTGKLFIGGIISATRARFQSLSFNTSPSNQPSHVFSFLMKTKQTANYDVTRHFYSTMKHFSERSHTCSYSSDNLSFHSFLQNSEFYNNSIGVLYVNENGDLVADLDIVNWLIFTNMSVSKVKCGSIQRQGSLDFKFVINQKAIEDMDMLNKVGKRNNSILP